MTRFSSDILLPFPNSNDLNSCGSLGQNLGQIRSNIMKKKKGTGISMGFFHILHEVYIYKQKGKGYRKT